MSHELSSEARQSTEYLRRHHVHTILNGAVELMLAEKPDNPRQWMGLYFADCIAGAPPERKPIAMSKEACQAWLRDNDVAEMINAVTSTLLKEQPAKGSVPMMLAKYFGAPLAQRRMSWGSSHAEIEEYAPKIFCMNSIKVPARKGETFVWCSCGRSQNQPFCDESHVALNTQYGTDIAPVRHEAKGDGVINFCGCRRTQEAPICDYTHLDLADAGGRAPVTYEFEPWMVLRKVRHNHNTVLLTMKMQYSAKGIEMASTYHFSIRNERNGKCRPYTPVYYDWETATAVFLVKEVPDGAVSPYLCGLEENDIIPIKGPSPGEYHYDEKATGLTYVLLAAGSGVTPIYQLMQALRDGSQNNRAHLFYSNKTVEDILVRDDLTKLAEDMGSVLVSSTFAITRAPPGEALQPPLVRGRIQSELVQKHLEGVDRASMRVIICGTPEFNRSMYFVAGSLGVAKEHVIFC